MEVPVTEGIGPATLDLLERAQENAAKARCASVLVSINTPGGNLETTRRIVELILNSPRPFLCLVSPSGGHAGSAGAIILQACHVSGAMPATNIGAATPISGAGGEIPETLAKKLIEDTRSWVESLADHRGRSKKFAADIVVEATALSAQQAAAAGGIDTVAESVEDFLQFAQDRPVKMADQQMERVQTGPVIRFQPDIRYQVLHFFTDPKVAYLLLMVSLGLLYLELTNPGLLLPGVAGGIGIVLSLISMHKLNVWWGGLSLILLGVALLVAEAFTPTFGILGIGGVAAFLIGSIFLYNPTSTGYVLPWDLIIPTTLVIGAGMMFVAYLAFRSFRKKKDANYHRMLGREGVVISLDGGNARAGQIRIMGEIWNFRSQNNLRVDQSVRVVGHEGLTLMVEPELNKEDSQ